jgi:hypothetical protein
MLILLAFRVFFRALFDAAAARRLRRALDEPTEPEIQTAEAKGIARETESKSGAGARPEKAKPATRSEALTLLAALQREARLLDIVKEPLSQYTDEQIGAAAREVLRDCGVVLDRMFGLQPLLAQEEGSDVEVPRGYDPLRYRLTGAVAGEPPFRGKLAHHGWQASRCELPEWTGGRDAALVVAAAEVEVT